MIFDWTSSGKWSIVPLLAWDWPLWSDIASRVKQQERKAFQVGKIFRILGFPDFNISIHDLHDYLDVLECT